MYITSFMVAIDDFATVTFPSGQTFSLRYSIRVIIPTFSDSEPISRVPILKKYLLKLFIDQLQIMMIGTTQNIDF